MKNHFCIKKITIFLIIFVGFFYCNNKVDAANDLYCYYDIKSTLTKKFGTNINVPKEYDEKNPGALLSWWDNYLVYIKFAFHNNSEGYSFHYGFYDKKNKKYIDDVASSQFMNHGVIIDATGTTQLGRWWETPDYTKCPSVSYIYEEGPTPTYWIYTIAPFDLLNGKFKSDDLKNINEQCLADNSNNVTYSGCGTIPKASDPTGKSQGNKSASVGSGSCKYKYISTSTVNDNYFVMSWNSSGITFSGYVDSENSLIGEGEGKYTIVTTMEPADIGNKCPNVLYGSSDNSSITVTKDTFGGSYDMKFGLVIEVNSSESDVVTDMNQSIKTGKTIKFIKQLYNFIRFIIPTMIIVLSILDFAGVVISGESDKMEKAKKRFVIRIVVGCAFIFVPTILELILKVAGVLKSNQNLADVVYNIIS